MGGELPDVDGAEDLELATYAFVLVVVRNRVLDLLPDKPGDHVAVQRDGAWPGRGLFSREYTGDAHLTLPYQSVSAYVRTARPCSIWPF